MKAQNRIREDHVSNTAAEPLVMFILQRQAYEQACHRHDDSTAGKEGGGQGRAAGNRSELRLPDPAPTDHNVAVIEDGCLAGCKRSLRFVEGHHNLGGA